MPVAHVPDEQTAPVPGHTVVQLPQCWVEMPVLVSQPFEALPSQSAKPALQVPRVHTPAVHRAVAFENVQADPHAPQFAVVSVGVSQPSLATPLQSPKPAAHVLQLPSTPQPRCPVPPQSASEQQARQARPPQQCVPAAQAEWVHVPSTPHTSLVQATPSLH